MEVTPATVAAEREWVLGRADRVVALINGVRTELGAAFGVEVEPVTREQYSEAVAATFADGDLAVNVAALVGLLRELDVDGDYPGFVVDELLGRRLAGMLAGGQPRSLLAEATFHYADVWMEREAPGAGPAAAGGSAGGEAGRAPQEDPAGLDDLDAALAAGYQTRLPGWPWTETASPFAIE